MFEKNADKDTFLKCRVMPFIQIEIDASFMFAYLDYHSILKLLCSIRCSTGIAKSEHLQLLMEILRFRWTIISGDHDGVSYLEATDSTKLHTLNILPRLD